MSAVGLMPACSGEGGDPERCKTCAAAGEEDTGGGTPAEGVAGAGGAAGEAGASGASGSSADREVSMSEISFWQSVRVPLELAGRAVPANAPIIANKESMLRVYVEPPHGFRARVLSAELEFGAALPLSATSNKPIRGASVHGEFASTFNFPIDAGLVLPGSSYAVTLRDGVGGPVLDRYPARERSALATDSAGDTLHVVIVPLVVNGLMPDVSPATLAVFRARVLSMYPVAELSLTTHAPVPTDTVVGPSQGWEELLDRLYAVRAVDAPAANVFYYGLFTPAGAFDEYCVSDCTVGYSVVADRHDVEDRGSIGLGIFSDGSNRDAPDTMAHELGHALGRYHAPCALRVNDAGPFPYPGGKVGVWGLDSVAHLLIEPETHGDVMGYCSPDWVSDFTYRALFDRIKEVNAEPGGPRAQVLLPARAYRRLLVRAEASLSWGSRFQTRAEPTGNRRTLSLLDGDGRTLATRDAAFRQFGDGLGGFLLVPEAALRAPGVRAVSVGRAVLPMP